MRRRKLLTAGLFLSINYAILVVATFCLMISALAYTMLDTVEIANDLLYAILQPFDMGDSTKTMIFIGGLLVGCIFLVVLSTKISKYSKYNEAMFKGKKGMIIFCILSFILAMGGYGFWLYKNMSGASFQDNMIINSVLAFNLFVHFISILLIIFECVKGFATKPVKQEVSDSEQLSSARPPIYTAGLDEDVDSNADQKDKKAPTQPKPVLEESDLSKKLVESIGKLDQMRKDGSITTQEYTKLRSQIIRNLTK